MAKKENLRRQVVLLKWCVCALSVVVSVTVLGWQGERNEARRIERKGNAKVQLIERKLESLESRFKGSLEIRVSPESEEENTIPRPTDPDPNRPLWKPDILLLPFPTSD